MDMTLGGRLGNQLFELAHAMSIHPKTMLFKIFSASSNHIKSTVSQIVQLNKIIHAVNLIPTMSRSSRFDGYFQSEQHFNRQLIRQRFYFDFPLTQLHRLKHRNIDFNSAVGLHVRRGDYLRFSQEYTVLPKEYYEKAYETYFSGKQVVIFSDDIDWCRQEFKFENQVFLHSDAVEDLMLFSMCRHHINSCSTYSWWGSWLGEKADSINVFPDEWFNPKHVAKQTEAYKKDWGIEAIVPARWIKMPWFYIDKGETTK